MEQFSRTLEDMMPHGYCLLWKPSLIYLHVIANALIALAYFSIPIAIFFFVKRRRDIEFKSLHWQFAAFIMLCGLTHVMGIVTLWLPLYWLQGAIMAGAALISLFAAVLVWQLMPVLLLLPGSAGLQQINKRLQDEIEERHRIETALTESRDIAIKASQDKSAFLSSVSHEIRTPMNGIIGIAELLQDTHLDQTQQNYVWTMQRSAHALLNIINDILDFSKIEADKLHLEYIAFDPTALAENCTLIVAPRAYEKKLSVVSHIAADVPPRLFGDPTRITQTLLNLLNNAVKFTHSGEVVLRVETCASGNILNADTDCGVCPPLPLGQIRRERIWSGNARLEGSGQDCTETLGWGEGLKPPYNSVQIRFSVSDTGIGIPAEQLDRLFEPFTQADASTTRLYGGTGLGLSICKRLVELMGGNIGVNSQKERGSVFWVQIPCAMVDNDNPVFAIPENLPKHVLLVGDDGVLRQSVSAYFDQWGVKVSAITAQELAIEQWVGIDDKPFLLLLEKHNSSVLLKLAKQAKTLAAMEVAMLLTFPDEEIAVEARMAGIGLLVQPVTRQALADLLAPPAVSEAQPAVPSATAAQPASASAALAAGNLILLAEDNSVNQMVAINLLKKLGHSAHLVTNGLEAVEAVTRLNYGLIFMDCQMPEMDGVEATRIIRQKEIASGGRIPIIAMTANAMAGDRENCLAAGMDDYISKPFDSVRLKQILDAWLPKDIAAEAADTSTILDWSHLRDFLGDDEIGIRDALQLFLEAMPSRIDALVQAVAQKDSKHLTGVLIDFKASSESFGAVRLAELLSGILSCVKQERWEVLTRQMERLKEEQRLLETVLEQQ